MGDNFLDDLYALVNREDRIDLIISRDRAVRIAVLREVGCSWLIHGARYDCERMAEQRHDKVNYCRRCAKLRELTTAPPDGAG